MKKVAFAAVTMMALLALLVSACGPAATPTPPPPPEEPTAAPEATPTEAPPEAVAGTPYKIGFCAAATGGGASLGMPERNTADMIAAQIEEAGGLAGPDGVVHPVEFLIYDTESTPDVATTVVSRLIEEDEVDAVVCGTLTGTSLAIVPLAEEAEVPYVSMASSETIIKDPETGEVREWVFKTAQTNGQSGEWQTLYAEAMGWDEVCDLYENTGYGQDCLANTTAMMEAKGIAVVYSDSFERTDTEFPQVASVLASGCDAAAIGAIPPGASMATVAVREGAPDLPVVNGHGVCNQAHIDTAGEAAEGTVNPCGVMMIIEDLPADHPQKEVVTQYNEDYTEFTGGEPLSTFGGHGWDAIMLAVTAMESLEEGLTLGERRAAIRDYIENDIVDWPGISGVFNMSPEDHFGLAYDSLTWVKVENGQWVWFPPEQW